VKVEVLLFAHLRELVGEGRVAVEAPDGATVSEVCRGLLRDRGAGSLGDMPLRFAVAESFVADDHVLRDGDEVAVIQPVSGG
jgi:molybdopterin converting factor subunit 1